MYTCQWSSHNYFFFLIIFTLAIDTTALACYNRINDSRGGYILRLAGGFCPLLFAIVVYWPVAIIVLIWAFVLIQTPKECYCEGFSRNLFHFSENVL